MWFPDGPGGDRFEEKEFRGPLSVILRDAIDFIARNYLKETVVKHPHQAEAERFWNFPLAAIEEALVNAIYHRSYEVREPVEVRITPQELTILSFPGADRSIRMEDLQSGRAISRRYRNRRIGEFLKELDLGRGAVYGDSQDPAGDARERVAGTGLRERRRPHLVPDPSPGTRTSPRWVSRPGKYPARYPASHRASPAT